MLAELRVRDLATIADVTLHLGSGVNVLTGETGAGKSMLVDALALLLGERAAGGSVRPGSPKAVVEGALAGLGERKPHDCLSTRAARRVFGGPARPARDSVAASGRCSARHPRCLCP